MKGVGKQLRLFRVDRWDSGLYFCSTNASSLPRHNVTLRVDQAPRMTQVQGLRRQALGYSATLRCRVEAVPVPQISWFKLADDDIHDRDESRPLPKPEYRRLHSSDDLEIAIHSFKDGLIESTLNIPAVKEHHFGKYR